MMYLEGRVVSGPLDSLVKLLLPLSTATIPPKRLADELDEVNISKNFVSFTSCFPSFLETLLSNLLLGLSTVQPANRPNKYPLYFSWPLLLLLLVATRL